MKAVKTKNKKIYLMGALANSNIPFIGNKFRKLGFEVYDDWWAPGPLADSYLKHYAKIRGLGYKETLHTHAAKHIYEFDKGLMDKADICVLVMNAGKSAHLEFGYFRGCNKPGYVLFDKEPSKIDIMYQFATDIFFNINDLIKELSKHQRSKK